MIYNSAGCCSDWASAGRVLVIRRTRRQTDMAIDQVCIGKLSLAGSFLHRGLHVSRVQHTSCRLC